MENNNERVLAYKLAKELDNSDIESVSGGSFRRTIKVSGHVGCWDSFVDVVYDW